MMSEHMKEDVIIAFVVVTLALILAVSCLVGCHECEESTRAAFKAGLYQQVQSGTVVWTKDTKLEKP